MDVSRRGFVQGAALAGVVFAGATAAGMMNGVQRAYAEDVSTAQGAEGGPSGPYYDIYGGEVRYLPVKKNDPPSELYVGNPAFEDRTIEQSEIGHVDTCDFLVIGAGVCGTMAALKAAEEGANVIIVEKMSRGRSTWESVGGYNSRAHAASGNKIDPAQFVDAILRSGYFRANPEVVWSYINNSGEAIDFMQDKLNESEYDIEIYNTTQPETGLDMVTIQAEHKFKVKAPVEWTAHITGMYPMAALTSVMNASDLIDLRLYTAGVQLVQDDSGRVTGAIVKNEEGYYQIDASMGVLLATGGYENNPELLQAWMRPEDIKVVISGGACTGPTGDGHMMGLRVGADIDPIPHTPMIFNGGFPSMDGYTCPIKSNVTAVAPLINGHGKRFCNEAHQKDCVANAINAAKNFTGDCWYVFDSNVLKTNDAPLDEYFENGTLLTGDTLEELAGVLGIPADEFERSIEKWNGYFDADTPTDLEFRRDLVSVNEVVSAMTDGKVRAGAMPVVDGPFYAMTASARLLSTVSGLIINENCQVIDRNGEIIEGLYAGGNTSGGMYSSTYPRHLPSVSVGRAVTFGFVAARHAVKGE